MTNQVFLNEERMKNWAPVLDHADLKPITDPYKRKLTALMLENTLTEGAWADQFLAETTSSIPTNFMGASSSTAGTGGIDTFDPVLISLVRRAMPNLLPYDIMGVQPMNGPTGLVFAMRSRYSNQTGGETFYNEVNTAFSTVQDGANTFGHKNVGTIPGATNTSPLTAVNTYNTATGMATAQLEALGADSNAAFPEMAFTIEKMAVTAVGRAMAAGYSLELAQDLKRIHGLEAEGELSNILISEILAEINREAVRTVNVVAKIGAQANVTTPGVFDLDTDSNGRWLVEKYKGLMMAIELECNQIAKQTRRGRGNMMICSSDVASALRMAGILDYTPALNRNDNLAVDDTGNTFAGVLNGFMKVYIDPYALGGNYATIGYKGNSPFDAGIFYCPYVPLQMVRAVDPQTFQPRIGYKTRYGMVANPYAEGLTKGNGALNINANVYYRKLLINNIL